MKIKKIYIFLIALISLFLLFFTGIILITSRTPEVPPRQIISQKYDICALFFPNPGSGDFTYLYTIHCSQLRNDNDSFKDVFLNGTLDKNASFRKAGIDILDSNALPECAHITFVDSNNTDFKLIKLENKFLCELSKGFRTKFDTFIYQIDEKGKIIMENYDRSIPTTSITPSTIPIESSTEYTCPTTEYVDCMPGPGPAKPQCAKEYLQWAQENCSNFQGAAY
jgi:hypothetical protein